MSSAVLLTPDMAACADVVFVSAFLVEEVLSERSEVKRREVRQKQGNVWMRWR
jgi:hypothetical protein